MSENTKQTPNYSLRRAAAGFGLAVLATAGVVEGGKSAVGAINSLRQGNQLYEQLTSPDALNQYNAGKIDHEKTLVVTAKKDSTADALAIELYGSDVNYRPMGDEINVQAGKNGVQAGEELVVPRSGLITQPSDPPKG